MVAPWDHFFPFSHLSVPMHVLPQFLFHRYDGQDEGVCITCPRLSWPGWRAEICPLPASGPFRACKKKSHDHYWRKLNPNCPLPGPGRPSIDPIIQQSSSVPSDRKREGIAEKSNPAHTTPHSDWIRSDQIIPKNPQSIRLRRPFITISNIKYQISNIKISRLKTQDSRLKT